MTLPTCRTCRFALPYEGDPASGWCHRVPPVDRSEGDTLRSTYPIIGLDKPGCGEHQRRPFITIPKGWKRG
ncbi:hypothetical protein [Bradyrhizobium japonicum]|uniref:hypothetical protein n=1 Tax=Bradyrhizobium japonicum TaxID=375 RepID=UPI0003FEEF77|nr:hypothetical protein [Bradyrhizobium japonicum]